MRLFDIVAGNVVIHTDTLGLPPFKKIWDSCKNKDLATKYISYIVLKNKYDSPYVKSLNKEDLEPTLKQQLFNNSNAKLPEEVLAAEQEYLNFNNTLTLRLLKNARMKLESISKYYQESLTEQLDEKKVKTILSGISTLGETIKSLDILEASVRAEEASTDKVKGGVEINEFELPSKL